MTMAEKEINKRLKYEPVSVSEIPLETVESMLVGSSVTDMIVPLKIEVTKYIEEEEETVYFE